MDDRLRVYTDGGCTGNPGPGGWAAIILDNPADPLELSGGGDHTTNNRMELEAVINALEAVRKKHGTSRKLEIHTDSQYVQKGISEWMPRWIVKGWKTADGKPVKNKDLWIRLGVLAAGLEITWTWVKGHAGDRWNERCDQLVASQRALYG
jgi:ribonuclease HI